MQVTGTTKVPVNIKALEGLLEAVKPDNIAPEAANFSIRLDARGNVKSSFAKADAKKKQLNIYTGALSTEWDTHFISSDGVTSDTEALVFVTCFASLALYSGQTSFEMSVDNMQTYRLDAKFEQVKTLFGSCMAKYNELAAQAPVMNVAPKDPSAPKAPKESKANKNEFAGQPLVDVPVLDIPTDIDL